MCIATIDNEKLPDARANQTPAWQALKGAFDRHQFVRVEISLSGDRNVVEMVMDRLEELCVKGKQEPSRLDFCGELSGGVGTIGHGRTLHMAC
jgi:hypothetical protein